ncbi:hypothetical protein IEQ34_023863 [Dendrobium chrysotoxum]|uniref:Uncharacterized protein n=1 Tax=Dendrobium chrysotoxum TaxID=161865 RepID=A0AAV7FPT0_DENCH|nr:hypothetical protein IEQ34_025886 [Dendrobium chrysotoxum]KAH0445412.1 hypothetical protein IEQ34_025497 [Dendrobium chrysotoxum]KAH0445454.1 hypothetical protein IEQ34_025461 [Dendrobium chrysotoxum]KAH0446093.1 hypothetical protein IEQ34_025074 [Dendrobium chrysotoxum]KAH0446654.1 hypothetical protein IEQ34_024519 [Dendrobium chrysotoxum]
MKTWLTRLPHLTQASGSVCTSLHVSKFLKLAPHPLDEKEAMNASIEVLDDLKILIQMEEFRLFHIHIHIHRSTFMFLLH